MRSRRRPGAAGQVETQAAGRSSCSAVSTRPVVPGDRGVHGWDSFLLPVRAGTNPCCNCGTSRLQTLFLSRFELGSKLLLVGVSRFWEAGRSCLCRRASRSVSRSSHAIRQELPSHSRLPVCRPRDWALACRQSRLLCAWPASFGERLVHSMQSFTPSVRTVAAAYYLFIYLLFSIVARRCRPCAVLPPLYLWLGAADRVRFYRH